MNVKKTIGLWLKSPLIIGFIIIMGIGAYFTYTALHQGVLFGYIENFIIEGLDSTLMFDYIILFLVKILAAFIMYSFIVVSIFIITLPLMMLSQLSYKRNRSIL